MSRWPDILDALNGVTRERVAWLTFGGTWAVPGTGYPSWVIGAADEGLVYEIPVDGPYTFGPVPPLGAGGVTAPSYRQSVATAVSNAIAIIKALPAGQRAGIGGYSMGAEAAATTVDEYLPGGQLAGLADMFVGGFTFGPPRRKSGTGLGPGGVPVPGHGISTNCQTVVAPNWIDYVNIDNGLPDRYGAVPDGLVGEIMGDGYEFGIDLQLSDPLGLVKAEVAHILTILQASGVTLKSVSSPLAILELGESAFVGLLTGLIPQLQSLGGVATDPKVAAAIEAATLGLQFALTGVRPHVTYDVDFILPGITFIQHAVGHVETVSRAALAA